MKPPSKKPKSREELLNAGVEAFRKTQKKPPTQAHTKGCKCSRCAWGE